VLGIAGHEVIGFSGLRAFEKAIIGFIGRLSDRTRGCDENALLRSQVEEILDTQRLKLKLRPTEHTSIFGEDRFREAKNTPAGCNGVQNGSRDTPISNGGGDEDIGVHDNPLNLRTGCFLFSLAG